MKRISITDIYNARTKKEKVELMRKRIEQIEIDLENLKNPISSGTYEKTLIDNNIDYSKNEYGVILVKQEVIKQNISLLENSIKTAKKLLNELKNDTDIEVVRKVKIEDLFNSKSLSESVVIAKALVQQEKRLLQMINFPNGIDEMYTALKEVGVKVNKVDGKIYLDSVEKQKALNSISMLLNSYTDILQDLEAELMVNKIDPMNKYVRYGDKREVRKIKKNSLYGVNGSRENGMGIEVVLPKCADVTGKELNDILGYNTEQLEKMEIQPDDTCINKVYTGGAKVAYIKTPKFSNSLVDSLQDNSIMEKLINEFDKFYIPPVAYGDVVIPELRSINMDPRNILIKKCVEKLSKEINDNMEKMISDHIKTESTNSNEKLFSFLHQNDSGYFEINETVENDVMIQVSNTSIDDCIKIDMSMDDLKVFYEKLYEYFGGK